MKKNHKKTPMIHLDEGEVFAYPKWFVSIYTPAEALLISQIIYKAQICGGVCRITDSELAKMCGLSLYPVRHLKEKIVNDKSFSPFLSSFLKEKDDHGGTFYEFNEDQFIEFKENIKKSSCMKHTGIMHETSMIHVSNIQVSCMKHTGTDIIERAPIESIRKNKKKSPNPLKGEVVTPASPCVFDFSQKKKKENFPPGFSQWWEVWPEKKEKMPAIKAYKSALKLIKPDELLKRTKNYFDQRQSKISSGVFVPNLKNPATWLNQRIWDEDDVKNFKEPDKPITDKEWLRNKWEKEWIEKHGTTDGFEEFYEKVLK